MQEQDSTGQAGGQRVSALREKLPAQLTEKELAEAPRDAHMRSVSGLVGQGGSRQGQTRQVAYSASRRGTRCRPSNTDQHGVAVASLTRRPRSWA